MKTVYNIEDFVIKEMLMPYVDLIVENPTEENINKVKRDIKKDPEILIRALHNNKRAYKSVFKRLAKLDFRFYKYLSHPIIDEIEAITLAFRYNKECDEN